MVVYIGLEFNGGKKFTVAIQISPWPFGCIQQETEVSAPRKWSWLVLQYDRVSAYLGDGLKWELPDRRCHCRSILRVCSGCIVLYMAKLAIIGVVYMAGEWVSSWCPGEDI